MFLLRIKDGSDWYVANWVLGRFAEEVHKECPDPSLWAVLQQGHALGGFCVDDLEPTDRTRLMAAFRAVIIDKLAGKPAGWKLRRGESQDTDEMYLGALAELRDLLDKP